MLSTTAEYALRIMVVLVESGGKPTTSERIAKLTHVPTDYSVKVLQMLARVGLVQAQRGRGGGFRLNCEAESTTLLNVVNAIEPIPRIGSCPLGREEHNAQLCPLHRRLDEVAAMLQESLGQMTLQSVVDGAEGPTLCPPADEPVVITQSAARPATTPEA